MCPPISLPHRWAQYLNILDYEERSSRNFAKLLRRAEYGIFTGNAAISLITKLCARFREARAGAAEARIAEMVARLLEDLHVRNALLEANRREREGLPPDEQGSALPEQAVDSFVVATAEDWEGLQLKAEEQRTEIQTLKRRVKAQQHHISVLRGLIKERRT